MNKIEAIAVITDKGDGYGKYIEWNDSILCHGLPSQTCLYTEDALQAVAEAVHQQWLLYCDNQSEMEMPDLAAIINQLTRQ